MTRYIQNFFMLLLVFLSQLLHSQTYPVQAVPTVISPYSSKITDYSNAMVNRINLQLVTTDLLVQNRPTQLHLKIQGNGITAQSNPVLSGIQPVYLNGGEILSLTSADLAGYFRYQNLQGLTSTQYSEPLPDGVYTICFQVYDVVTRKWLSQNSCATIYLMLNDPPQLNLPSNNEQIPSSDFPNIIFSWTPRHMNATNVSYDYELKEILDPNLDPAFAFEVSPLLHKEEGLRTTTLLYDIGKPTLIPGKRYAWRVKAISTSGLAENSVFKNNGFSQIHSFTYNSNCDAPRYLLSEQQSQSRVKLMWQGENTHKKYHVQYRKANVENAEWFEVYTVNTQTILQDLEAGFTYEFRVGATCDATQFGTEQSYVYSGIQTFEIDKDENATAYNCGIVPDIEVTNQQPLGAMVINETFMAGDFPVKVLSVQGSSGVFIGTGYIQVPYLFDTRIGVVFDNIRINSDYQLVDGMVETTYDPEWGNVDYINDLVEVNQQDVKVDFPIDTIEVRNGEIIVTGPNGQTETFPGGKDTVITDSTGNSYYVDADGNVSGPHKQAPGGKPTPENTDGVDKNGEVTALTAEGIKVTFEKINNETQYAFDQVLYKKALTKEYKEVSGEFVPFKAVPNGKEDKILAKVAITGSNVNADSLIFRTQNGVQINAERVGTTNDFVLKLKGAQKFAWEEVQAAIKQGAKYKVAGVFNFVHISPKTVNVKLVPTSSAINVSNKIAEIKAIYNQLAIDVQIDVEEPFDIATYLVNDKLPTEDHLGDLSTYSSAQNAIIDAFTKAPGRTIEQAYYLFVTDKQASNGQDGYMRLNNQFGFVFSNTAHTIAHELAHGAFKLEHPFKKYKNKGLKQGDTQGLMDYGNGTELLFTDWKQINDPAFKLYAFQGQSDGEFNGGYAIAPDYTIFSVGTSTLTDELDYTLEKNKGYSNDGTLPGFKLNDKLYYWDYDEDRYFTKVHKADGTVGKEPYNLNEIEKSDLDSKKYIYLFFNKNNPCGLTTYKSVLADKYIKFKDGALPEFIHANDGQRKDLPCVKKDGTGNQTSNSNTHDNWQYEPGAKGNNTENDECTGFDYLSTPASKDIELVKAAFIKGFNSRKSITSEERNQGTLYHVQIANATSGSTSEDLPSDEMELLEDKLHLLTHYKSDTYIGLVFLKKDVKQFYKQDALDELSLNVMQQAKGSLGGKKALLIVVPYSYKFDRDSKCLPSLGFAQTQDNDVVKYSDVKTDNVKNWFNRILTVYAQVPKPLMINRYYKTADGTIIQRSENASKNIKGYPFIKTLNFYESKGYDEILNLNKEYKGTTYQTNFSLYQEYLGKAKQIYFNYTTKEQQEGAINNANIWNQISSDDLGKFREIHMNDTLLTNKLWEDSKDSWAWGSKVEISFGSSELQTKHFYNFDRMVLLDDVVFGTLDGIGLIPGVDTFTDPIGAVYAGVRGDYTNATIYSASFAIPLAGSAYIKGSLKVGEDATKLYGVVARSADNVDGYVLDFKKISEINADEVHISSVFWGGDQKLTQKVLNEVKKDADSYINKDFVKDALKYKKAVGPLLGDAKNLIIDAFGRSTKFADDPKTVEKVAEFLLDSNKKAFQSIGGKNGLEEIIRANVRVGCSTCGTASTNFLKNMDEYLDDVLDFSTNYSKKGGFDDVLKELKKVNTSGSPNYAMEGAAFMIDKIKRTPEITPASVKKFDGKFEGEIDHICEKCRFDIELNDGTKFEYKSYNEASISRISTSDTFLKQHLSYLADAEDISKLRYEFDAKKFANRDKIVEQFKKMYEKNAEQVFEANQDLFKTYDRIGGGKIRNLSDFENLLKSDKFNSNHPMFNFIKAEK